MYINLRNVDELCVWRNDKYPRDMCVVMSRRKVQKLVGGSWNTLSRAFLLWRTELSAEQIQFDWGKEGKRETVYPVTGHAQPIRSSCRLRGWQRYQVSTCGRIFATGTRPGRVGTNSALAHITGRMNPRREEGGARHGELGEKEKKSQIREGSGATKVSVATTGRRRLATAYMHDVRVRDNQRARVIDSSVAFPSRTSLSTTTLSAWYRYVTKCLPLVSKLYVRHRYKKKIDIKTLGL